MAEPTDTKPGGPENHNAQMGQLLEQPQSSISETNQDLDQTQNSQDGTPQADLQQQASIGHTNEHPDITALAEESPFDTIDESIAGLETSQSLSEEPLPSWDTALPSVGSSAAADLSLPALDTTLPSLESSLPAIGTDIPTMDSAFGDDSPFDTNDHHQSGSDNPGETGNSAPPPGSANVSTHYQAAPNGEYQYTQHPPPPPQHHPDRQQQPQAPSQHQFQAQPQPSYQQPSPDMYHNQGGFSAVNANPGNNGQGQHGQIPQAPIGSPMPPMSSMGQYMTGYPSNVPQGMDARYSIPGDPSKMLSSARHKKEVKRRTKTGCLTCRKRRIKVCVAI